jgi:hypothetical protein
MLEIISTSSAAILVTVTFLRPSLPSTGTWVSHLMTTPGSGSTSTLGTHSCTTLPVAAVESLTPCSTCRMQGGIVAGAVPAGPAEKQVPPVPPHLEMVNAWWGPTFVSCCPGPLLCSRTLPVDSMCQVPSHLEQVIVLGPGPVSTLLPPNAGPCVPLTPSNHAEAGIAATARTASAAANTTTSFARFIGVSP